MHKGLCSGGLTARFGKEFLDLYSNTFESFMKAEGRVLAPPIKIQLAGNADTDGLVMNEESERFCTQASSCTVTRYSKSKHQILKEIDSIRGPAIEELIDFFKQHKGELVPQK